MTFLGVRRDIPSTNLGNLPAEQHLCCLGPPNSIDDDLAYLVNA